MFCQWRKIYSKTLSGKSVWVILYLGVVLLTSLALFSTYVAMRFAYYMLDKDLDVIARYDDRDPFLSDLITIFSLVKWWDAFFHIVLISLILLITISAVKKRINHFNRNNSSF